MHCTAPATGSPYDALQTRHRRRRSKPSALPPPIAADGKVNPDRNFNSSLRFRSQHASGCPHTFCTHQARRVFLLLRILLSVQLRERLLLLWQSVGVKRNASRLDKHHSSVIVNPVANTAGNRPGSFQYLSDVMHNGPTVSRFNMFVSVTVQKWFHPYKLPQYEYDYEHRRSAPAKLGPRSLRLKAGGNRESTSSPKAHSLLPILDLPVDNPGDDSEEEEENYEELISGSSSKKRRPKPPRGASKKQKGPGPKPKPKPKPKPRKPTEKPSKGAAGAKGKGMNKF
ncbi:hypothetical protein B0H17DRAFT_1133301 [Mycena rosella]|uniref:Uncharacterized protein n=1 Tax=Mycena rosella TaxID=1033263 RepID=A0AAD7DI77_MYCRO|nr:hypothetical protein B0H17DRAFT_1133301 [Mycena rosella]